MSWLLWAFIGVVAAVLAVLVWLRSRYLIVTVQGRSMIPTFQPDDRLLVRRRPGHGVAAGEVVLVDLPADIRPVPAEVGRAEAFRQRRIIKRVAATGGQPAPSAIENREPIVPFGQLALLGDNHWSSGDSRQFGYVPVDAVVGVVLRRTVTSKADHPNAAPDGSPTAA